MKLYLLKLLVAAALIAGVSGLSNKKPELSGFLTSLPLTSMIALLFSYLQFSENEKTVVYAKSIFASVPLSLLFFVPFLVSEKLNLNFWMAFISGVGLLGMGFLIHSKFFS